MTLDEIVFECLLAVNGGQLTSDADTRYGEAESFVYMAINFLMSGNYFVESKAMGGSTVNPLMWTPFENIPVLYDSGRRQRYSDLTKRVITLPKGQGITLYTKCGKTIIPLDQGDEAMNEYYGKYKTIINYQPEGQYRVWYWNMPPLIAAVRGKQLVEITEMAGDDEILLPSDGYVKLLDMVTKWMTGEEQAPKRDLKQDAIDN